ncbi:MAG: hypothetical protein EXS67_04090 [Candidatus Margulisbacteria bacterium]|nr:hypothetical protein [Candidatus Margulisiibacteriota bacterium]
MERINISGSFGISGEARKSSSINNDEDPDQFQNLLNDISGHIEEALERNDSAYVKDVAPTPEPLKTYRPEISNTSDPLYALHQLQIQLLDGYAKPKPPATPRA